MLMTHKVFTDTYKGVAVDFDGHFGAQCVDLVRQYIQDVLGLPQPEGTGTKGAIEFFNGHGHRPMQNSRFDLVAYKPGMIPPRGAVVIFKPVPSNRFGHIAIVEEANEHSLVVFEQDGTANSRALAENRPQRGAFFGEWKYGRLAGWLLPKAGAGR